MKKIRMKLRIAFASVVFSLSALVQNPLSEIADTKHPLVQESVKQVVKSIYPIEKVGVIARSVTFPSVLNQGQGIINTKYPNASVLCMDVTNYSGLVTGLIWSMDRELVEEYGLQYLIDRATRAILPCAAMLMPPGQGLPEQHALTQDSVDVQLATLDGATPEIKEKTAAVSMEDAKKALVPQIEKIQEIIKFAQTVKSKQGE